MSRDKMGNTLHHLTILFFLKSNLAELLMGIITTIRKMLSGKSDPSRFLYCNLTTHLYKQDQFH